MKTDGYGIILNVGDYGECISFCRNAFKSKVIFTKIEGDLSRIWR